MTRPVRMSVGWLVDLSVCRCIGWSVLRRGIFTSMLLSEHLFTIYLSLFEFIIFYIVYIVTLLLEVKRPYEPSCPSVVSWPIGRSVYLSVIISSFTSYAPIGALIYFMNCVQRGKNSKYCMIFNTEYVFFYHL